jgi:Cu+-exporting ATPase
LYDGVPRAGVAASAGAVPLAQHPPGPVLFAFAYNALGVPLAAILLLSPMVAAAAMSLSSVSVIGNALRLRALRL